MQRGDYAQALDLLRPVAVRGHFADPDQWDRAQWDIPAREGFVIISILRFEELWKEFKSLDAMRPHESDFNLAFELANATAGLTPSLVYYVGYMHLSGIGTPDDFDAAEEWLAAAADSADEAHAKRAKDLLCEELWNENYC